MGKEVITHISELFFTTKDLGKGTGLGLSTVFGAIKQNKGFIDVASQLGQGTVFTIFLPRETNAVTDMKEIVQTTVQPCNETILLVENDDMLLKLATIMLEKSGCKVLSAQTAELAIKLAREYTYKIHLLLTDVIMPNMNGKDIYIQSKTICPDVKIHFMSGYTADIIATQGVIADNQGTGYAR
jgi:two-component system cell cycle sensor histidine kinase/response regulator CckA